MKIRNTHVWASSVACLAIAVAAVGSAFAENEANKDTQKKSGQQSASRSDSQSEQQSTRKEPQTSQSTEQRQQQARQREQQARQRSEQQQWDQNHSGQRGERQSRDRQFSRDLQRGEQQSYNIDRTQRESGGGNQAGLGVNIISDGGAGIIVVRVNPGSPADEMGLETRDRITRINGQDVKSVNEFISQIRNMDPGDVVELDIRRDRDQQTIRGELASREQAVVIRGPQGQRGISQSGYEEQRGSAAFSQGRSSRGDASGRIEQIERQVNRLSQEIDELRFALRDIRQQSDEGWNHETTAGYDEYQPGIGPRRSAERGDSDSNRYRQFDGSREIQRSREQGPERGILRSRDSNTGQSGQRSRESQAGQRGERSQYNSDRNRSSDDRESESPGGETGESRQHPDRD